MVDRKLKIAFWNYDRTRALADGTVTIPDVEATFHSARIVAEIFEGVIRGEFDVSELGMTYYLRTFRGQDSPFLAIPIFLNRVFRHSAIYINKASGIAKPEDLNGKTIGRARLVRSRRRHHAERHVDGRARLQAETCRWMIGGLDWPMKPIDFVAKPHPDNVNVNEVPAGKDLGTMLEAGEIDALISANNPKCILENSPKVARLFPDYVAVEREYYKRTGIFPIMHTVVIRKDRLAQYPELANIIYTSFCKAKDAAVKQYEYGRIFNNVDTMFPWFTRLIEDDRAVLGNDWWPYGIEANRKALETLLRYHFEQGITERLFRIEDIFVRELLST
jgi:4,5-dihydroxyphthalate decarboxylase